MKMTSSDKIKTLDGFAFISLISVKSSPSTEGGEMGGPLGVSFRWLSCSEENVSCLDILEDICATLEGGDEIWEIVDREVLRLSNRVELSGKGFYQL